MKPGLGRMAALGCADTGHLGLPSALRFQLVCWPSLPLDVDFCAPLYGAELPFGSVQLALE